MMRGADRSSILPRYTLERVRGAAVATGGATDAEFDEAIAAFDDPDFSMMSHVMMSVWGQKSG